MSPVVNKDGNVECKGKYVFMNKFVLFTTFLFGHQAIGKYCFRIVHTLITYEFIIYLHSDARITWTRTIHWSSYDDDFGWNGINVCNYLCCLASVQSVSKWKWQNSKEHNKNLCLIIIIESLLLLTRHLKNLWTSVWFNTTS